MSIGYEKKIKAPPAKGRQQVNSRQLLDSAYEDDDEDLDPVWGDPKEADEESEDNPLQEESSTVVGQAEYGNPS
jgi:hypothetical protein